MGMLKLGIICSNFEMPGGDAETLDNSEKADIPNRYAIICSSNLVATFPALQISHHSPSGPLLLYQQSHYCLLKLINKYSSTS